MSRVMCVNTDRGKVFASGITPISDSVRTDPTLTSAVIWHHPEVLNQALLSAMAESSASPSSDWPRFINNPRVDAAAMYDAYVKAADPSQPWFGKLPLEKHASPKGQEPVAPVPACFKEVQCVEPGCYRCEVKRGGYSFRWFHPLWEKEYMATKQPLAWHPHETALIAEERDRQFQLEVVLNQRVRSIVSTAF